MPTKGEKRITAYDIRVLKACMTGKYLRASFKYHELRQNEDAKREIGTNPYKTLNKLKEMGIIDGFAPILTEKGKKILDAFELLHNDGSDDLLDDAFG